MKAGGVRVAFARGVKSLIHPYRHGARWRKCGVAGVGRRRRMAYHVAARNGEKSRAIIGEIGENVISIASPASSRMHARGSLSASA